MTTAPRAATGNDASSGARNDSVATTAPKATSECSWLLLPIASPSTVRLPEELTGNPLANPFATFTTPSASSSWPGSIRCRCLAANARAVSTLSV